MSKPAGLPKSWKQQKNDSYKIHKTSNFTLLQCIEIYLQYLHVSPSRISHRTCAFWGYAKLWLHLSSLHAQATSEPCKPKESLESLSVSRWTSTAALPTSFFSAWKNGWHAMILLWMHLPMLLRCFLLLATAMLYLKLEEVQRGSTLTTVSSDWILTVPATQTLFFIWSEPRILEHKVLVLTKPMLFRNLTRDKNKASSIGSIVSITGPPPSASSPPQSLQPVDPWMTCARWTQVCKMWNGLPLKSRQVEFLAWWLKLHGSLKFTNRKGMSTWSQSRK